MFFSLQGPAKLRFHASIAPFLPDEAYPDHCRLAANVPLAQFRPCRPLTVFLHSRSHGSGDCLLSDRQDVSISRSRFPGSILRRLLPTSSLHLQRIEEATPSSPKHVARRGSQECSLHSQEALGHKRHRRGGRRDALVVVGGLGGRSSRSSRRGGRRKLGQLCSEICHCRAGVARQGMSHPSAGATPSIAPMLRLVAIPHIVVAAIFHVLLSCFHTY